MTTFSSRCTTRYGDPAEDHRGARMRAHERHGCVVVAVAGELDGANVDYVIDYALRYATATGAPFVLDLSAVSSCTPNCVRLLRAVDAGCTGAGISWALVAGEAVQQRLRGRDGQLAMPLIDSVSHAQHAFDDAVTARRRAVTALLGRTA